MTRPPRGRPQTLGPSYATQGIRRHPWTEAQRASTARRLRSVMQRFRLVAESGAVPQLVVRGRNLSPIPSTKGCRGSFTYVRVMLVLLLAEMLLKEGKTATQRDIFYRLKGLFPIFKNATQVNNAICLAAIFMHTPRYGLGMTCSSRGAFAGSFLIQENMSSVGMLDASQCTTGGGFQIPGDPNAVLSYVFIGRCECILIIEKDAVFQRLVEDRIFDTIPCALITGKGFPDVCTRMFASCLSKAMPNAPVLGMADWNPSGVSVLSVLKNGSDNGVDEAKGYTLPGIHWFAAKWNALQNMRQAHFQPLSSRDRRRIETLNSSGKIPEDWSTELEIMRAGNIKAEIEAITKATHAPAGFTSLVSAELRCFLDQLQSAQQLQQS